MISKFTFIQNIIYLDNDNGAVCIWNSGISSYRCHIHKTIENECWNVEIVHWNTQYNRSAIL